MKLKTSQQEEAGTEAAAKQVEAREDVQGAGEGQAGEAEGADQAMAAAQEQQIAFRDLPDNYRIIERIGEGAFSTVYKAFDAKLSIEVAIKVIDKKSMNKEQISSIFKEISIMRRIQHDNIVKMYNYIDTAETTFIVLEFVNGGEIFNQIIKYTYFSEDLSRHVIVQVVEALKYLHEEVGVVHRDLKPENLLFEIIPFKPGENIKRKSDDNKKVSEGAFIEGVGGGGIGKVKIADFGLSKVLWDSNTKTPCGTASYTAPEIIRDEKYNKSVDMWAIGCVLYTLLCGFPPFYDTDNKILTKKVSRGEYTFLSPWWDEISKESKDLVSHLLTVDPVKRYTCDEFLNHPWVLQNKKPTTPAIDSPILKPGPHASGQLKLKFQDVPRVEVLKRGIESGIEIQRNTPMKILSDYFDEDDDEEDEDEDEDDESDSEDEDGSSCGSVEEPRLIYQKSGNFPRTPYTKPEDIHPPAPIEFHNDSSKFDLKMDGKLHNRRKLAHK